MLLYVSCPAVSHNESFMCFCGGSFFDGEGGGSVFEGLLMLSEYEAGGPTGTMRDPNSTPIVTSWWGEKRPSQSRTVSCISSVRQDKTDNEGYAHSTCRSPSRPATQSSQCNPTAAPFAAVVSVGWGVEVWR